MPHIAMTTSVTLTPAQRDTVAKEFGKLISLLPGKSEAVLMIDIADGRNMYYAGAACDCAYLNVGLYQESPTEAKAAFAAAVCRMLEKEAGLAPKNIYLNFSEYPAWCSGGALK